jgi:hypothetical protein
MSPADSDPVASASVKIKSCNRPRLRVLANGVQWSQQGEHAQARQAQQCWLMLADAGRCFLQDLCVRCEIASVALPSPCCSAGPTASCKSANLKYLSAVTLPVPLCHSHSHTKAIPTTHVRPSQPTQILLRPPQTQ